MNVLLVSPNPETRELMGLAVAGISRRVGEQLHFVEASNGEKGVAAAQWFPLDALPPRSEVAHNGWSLGVLKKMAGTAAR